MNHRPHHPAEDPGQTARHQQSDEPLRQTAGQRRQSKQDKTGQQDPLALEAVDKGRRQHAGCGRAETVGRHQKPEFVRADAERRHENGAERHHDHEIQHMTELDARQRQDPEGGQKREHARRTPRRAKV